MPKPLFWIASSKADLKAFPDEVGRVMGFALWQAQLGKKHPSAMPLKGFHGAGVLEVTDDYDGNTYRSIYTLKFAGAIYVLCAFQKKSKRGTKTPKHVIDLIHQRLKTAKEHYENWLKTKRPSQAEDDSAIER
jgi:phage-related protein